MSLKPGKGVPFGVSISWSGGDTPALDSSLTETVRALKYCMIKRTLHSADLRKEWATLCSWPKLLLTKLVDGSRSELISYGILYRGTPAGQR